DKKYELLDDVIVKDGYNINKFRLKMRSRWNAKTIIEEYQKGALYWVKTENFAIRVIYTDDKESKVSPRQIIFTNSNNNMKTLTRFDEKVGTTDNGSKALEKLLESNIFTYPKPVSLVEYFISILWDELCNNFNNSDIILDFFSGSATTAHATMQLNVEDGGNRKFIMVQLPEETDEKSEAYKAGYKNICEVGKERIRRAGKKILEENKDKEGIENLD